MSVRSRRCWSPGDSVRHETTELVRAGAGVGPHHDRDALAAARVVGAGPIASGLLPADDSGAASPYVRPGRLPDPLETLAAGGGTVKPVRWPSSCAWRWGAFLFWLQIVMPGMVVSRWVIAWSSPLTLRLSLRACNRYLRQCERRRRWREGRWP